MSGKYDDIIALPHPEPRTHPRMSLHDRAAQFSPFAALTGHSAAIAETGRLTDSRITLDESEMARVDAELQHLQELLPGSYQTVTGTARRIDTVNGALLLTDQRAIPIPDIFNVTVQEDALP